MSFVAREFKSTRVPDRDVEDTAEFVRREIQRLGDSLGTDPKFVANTFKSTGLPERDLLTEYVRQELQRLADDANSGVLNFAAKVYRGINNNLELELAEYARREIQRLADYYLHP